MPNPWNAEVEVTEELTRRLLESQFPELAPVKLEPFGEGWDNTAYVVNGEWVFRFPRRQLAGPLMTAECRILPLIARSVPLPVPLPSFMGSPTDYYPWQFAGYRLLKGVPASEADLTAADRAALAEPLARFLLALHSIPVQEATKLGAGGDTIGRLDLFKRIPLARKMLDRFRADLPFDTSNLDGLLDRAPTNFQPGADCVVHGDLYYRHLLVDDARQLCGVIDWGDCHIGDRALDLLPIFTMLPAPAREDFFRSYGVVSELTVTVARARSLYHTLNVLRYARDICDTPLEQEALYALRLLAE